MARDRFIHFEAADSHRVARGLVDICGQYACEYFSTLATDIKWVDDRYIVTLPGICKFLGKRPTDYRRERWIEIWVGDYVIDVMTRTQDDITNDIADGFARRVARKFKGRLDEDAVAAGGESSRRILERWDAFDAQVRKAQTFMRDVANEDVPWCGPDGVRRGRQLADAIDETRMSIGGQP